MTVVVEGPGAGISVAVFVCTHPTSKQAYPGIQQPPPGLLGQSVYPSAQVPRDPAQVWPFGQHPTSPKPVSCTIIHVDPVPQQLFGRLIEVQAEVPDGQLKSRVSKRCQPGNRASNLGLWWWSVGVSCTLTAGSNDIQEDRDVALFQLENSAELSPSSSPSCRVSCSSGSKCQ